MGWEVGVYLEGELLANYHSSDVRCLPGYWDFEKQWHNHHVDTVLREIRTTLKRLQTDKPVGWKPMYDILVDLKYILMNDIPLRAICIYEDHEGPDSYRCSDVVSEAGEEKQEDCHLYKSVPKWVACMDERAVSSVTFMEKVYDMLKEQEGLVARMLKLDERERALDERERALDERERALEIREKDVKNLEKHLYQQMTRLERID